MLNPDLLSYPEATHLESLECPFSENEVEKAIRQLRQDKTLGPDDFPIFFYSRFWDIMREDIMPLFSELYHNKLDLQRLNYATVVLVPKKRGDN